jgi:hypothetical protein
MVLPCIGRHHPLDGVTNSKYRLLPFLTKIFFGKTKKALAFNRDRCGHLALCLPLILFILRKTANSQMFKLTYCIQTINCQLDKQCSTFRTRFRCSMRNPKLLGFNLIKKTSFFLRHEAYLHLSPILH